jgi:hypothetical protein
MTMRVDPIVELNRRANDTSQALLDAVIRWRNAYRAVALHRTRHTPGGLLVELQFATTALLRVAGTL